MNRERQGAARYNIAYGSCCQLGPAILTCHTRESGSPNASKLYAIYGQTNTRI